MKEEYIKNKGIYCPYCKSTRLRANGNLSAKYAEIKEFVTCYDCGSEWYDVYKLQDIKIIKKGIAA